MNEALSDPVSSILWDDSGRTNLEDIFSNIAKTEFEYQNIKRILSISPSFPNWRVGEALAEAFLVTHRDCMFPWPSGRDLKNPNASPAGTDLVGFKRLRTETNTYCFAFGEVKTSQQKKWPPDVVKGRHGLVGQIEALRDSHVSKDELVRYLGLHAPHTDWLYCYQSAASRYLNDPKEVALFGLLVRDVDPNEKDLSGRARRLSKNCPSATKIELRAMYLPKNSIETLHERAIRKRGDPA